MPLSDLRLKRLTVFNFKNIAQADLELDYKINCFVGPNGAGKTNLLDAIYYLSFTKSYFNITDSQAIRFGQTEFSLKGIYQRNSTQETILIIYRKDTKTVKRNDKKYKKLAQHIGLLPAVIITPEDSKIIASSAEERRRFIDVIISQADPQYLEALLRYKRILQQRNKLIKNFALQRYVDHQLLELWDERLDATAKYIFQKRREFIHEFKPLLQKYYSQIATEDETIDVIYKSQLNDADLLQLLRQNLNKDLALSYTYAGTHRDDIEFLLQGQPIRKFGSQGQQKSLLLALKFAQSDFIKKHLNIKPILLLDDIFDKLDPNRAEKLVNLVAQDHFGQIFITHTNPTALNKILTGHYKIFKVQNGQIADYEP